MINFAHEEGSVYRQPLKRPWLLVVSSMCLAILFLEFFYHLPAEPWLYRVVIVLDYALIGTYFLLCGLSITARKYPWLDVIRQEKADVLYGLLILAFIDVPRVAAGLVVVRLLIALVMRALESKMGTHVLAMIKLRPSQTLALSFIGLISAGSLLLTFPAATLDGKGASFIDAVFMMTSASCVAGLTVLDIGTTFSRFGQTVILFGIQAGGLGIMFLSAAFAVLVGGTITGRRQAGMRAVLDVSTPEGLKSLIRAVITTTVATEAIGIISLFFLTTSHIPTMTDRLWWSIFHSISAFCNAGLGLWHNSLVPFVDDTLICVVFMILITIGGIGFFVIADVTDSDVWRVKKIRAVWDRLQVQSKVVIVASLILNITGMMLFLFFEYDGALRDLSAIEKIIASLFYSISLRSAGFNVVPLGALANTTVIFSIALMFIGASPGSTGGGIKTTTAAISVVSLRAMLWGREDVELFGRRIDSFVINRSLSIVLVAVIIIALFLTLLVGSQNIPFEKLFFEVVSAFGTVGMTMDTTTQLNDIGKLLIICVMYIGRIGPLTLALAIGERKISQSYRLPKGSIAVG